MSGVMFKTQQGRTLYREDLTAEDIGKMVGGGQVDISGVEVGYWRQIEPDVYQQPVFHACTRHIVEWWDVTS